MDPTDAELARRIAAAGGDPQAEAALCARFARRAFLYGVKHLHDDAAAHDLAQEVLVTVITALRAGRVQEPERLASFVLGTCRLVSTGWQRRERRREALSAGLVVETSAEPAQVAVGRERLERCFDRLPAREQRLLVMSFHEDRDGDEIAEALGLASGHVRVLRHRAIAALRACVEPKPEVIP